MSTETPQVGIIGAGAWGTALAILANRAGSKAMLWTRNAQVIDSIRQRRENAQYLPDQFIDPAIEVTDRTDFIAECDMLVVTIPAQSLRTVAISLSDTVPSNVPIIIATKGIERGSLMLMSEVLQSILPYNPYAILSGPNFAREAAQGLPTATTLALHQTHLADTITFALGGKYFRLYVNEDPIGTQIGGAVKNVLAIAAGIVEGRGLGENARSALITRGVVEIARLAKAKGGDDATLMGLSGIGDMLLTCTSGKSRNYALGVAIGRGAATRNAGLTEGVATAESVSQLARKLGVAMPIAFAVHDVLGGHVPVASAIERLLERPVTSEL
ncbi:MAG: NAD(P)H-dependent glycerol-3-phosphate dehydrogenase [Alphaproteobacteria bacterium]|nr:NAD(P)H-dependent glycerol-3-phosphate dehydrogenase [Alphaproteobacteria bacterium]